MNTIEIVAMLMERFARKFPSEIKVGGFGKNEKTTYVVTFPYAKKVKFTFDGKSDYIRMEYAFKGSLNESLDGNFIQSLVMAEDNKDLYPFKVFEIDDAFNCYDEAIAYYPNMYTLYKKEEFTNEILDSLVKLMLKPTPTMQKLFAIEENSND